MVKVEIPRDHEYGYEQPRVAERLQPQPTISSVEIGSAHVPVSLEVILPRLDATKAGGLYPYPIEEEFKFRDTVESLVDNLDPSALALDGISRVGLKQLSANLSIDYISKKIAEEGRHTHIMPHVSWKTEITEDLDHRLRFYESQGADQVLISNIPTYDLPANHPFAANQPLTPALFTEPLPPSNNLGALVKKIQTSSTTIDQIGLQIDINRCFTDASPHKMDRMARNLELADFAITQFLFDVYDYVVFRKEMDKRGVTTPVIPGVLAFANLQQAQEVAKENGVKFSERSVRDDLLHILPFGAPSSTVVDPSDPEHGAPYVKGICSNLIKEGAPGLHIYTLNNAPLTVEVVEGLQT